MVPLTAPDEILNCACEYTSCEEILLSQEKKVLTSPEAKAFLRSRRPLVDVFKFWEKLDAICHMDEIWETVAVCADTVITLAK